MKESCKERVIGRGFKKAEDDEGAMDKDCRKEQTKSGKILTST